MKNGTNDGSGSTVLINRLRSLFLSYWTVRCLYILKYTCFEYIGGHTLNRKNMKHNGLENITKLVKKR